MIKSHLKIAWRNMILHRMSTLINLAGLTIGMTAAFLIFMWVENEYSYDSYHPDAENIYRLKKVSKTDTNDAHERTSYLLGEQIKAQVPEVKAMARLYPLVIFPPTVEAGEQIFKEKAAAYADEGWFKMFEAEFVQGSAESFNSGTNNVAITQSNARRYFGNENPVGKTLKVNGTDCIVQGVIKDYPSNSSFRFDMYISDAMRPVNALMRKNKHWVDSYQTFIKLTSVSSIERALDKMNAIPDDHFKVALVPLEEIHFESLGFSFLKHGDKKLTNILFLLGLLLLGIACINYVNLTTAKASTRIKEVSVKKIVGADRKHLFLQFVIETGLVSIVALIATLILVSISLPQFNRFTDNHFVLSLNDPDLWQLLAGTCLCTLLLASIYPALLLSSFKPVAALRSAASQNSGGGLLRKSLVVMQFAFSIALVISTIVIYKQMQFIDRQYDNYDKSQLFSFLFRSDLQGEARVLQMETVKQQLLSNSNIQNVSITSTSDILSISNLYVGAFDWDGRTDDAKNEINFIPLGADFKEIANLRLKEGRWFSPGRKDDQKNYILNETAVRELGIRQPVIGQRFSLLQDTGVVIGVVDDFHYLGLREKIGPMVFGNNNSVYANSFLVKSMPGKQASALAATEEVWKHFMPGQPFDYQFASDEYERIYRTDKKAASLIWSFSLLAIFISCLGLYGLASFSAERRQKEIGIRKVLGISVPAIVSLLSLDFVKLVIIAMFLAFPIGWWAMQKWLQGFAYHIDIQWWMFVLAGVLALLIALTTISYQAIKAAMMNPVHSLRSE